MSSTTQIFYFLDRNVVLFFLVGGVYKLHKLEHLKKFVVLPFDVPEDKIQDQNFQVLGV